MRRLWSVPDAVVDRLLDVDLDHDPVTAQGLSNHLPMALLALGQLGASDIRLRSYAEMYEQRLVPARQPIEPIDEADLVAALGTGRRYADWRSLFEQQVAQRGLDETLAAHLPLLLGGLGGAAFHGLIRLGYALEHSRPDDIVAALAYLADSYQAVSTRSAPRGGGAADPEQLLADIGAEAEVRELSLGAGGFSSRFARGAASRALLCHLDRPGDPGDAHELLARIAAVTHQLYRAAGDFFALHTMTATHAVRLTLPHLLSDEDRSHAVDSLLRAIATAYVVIGAPGVAPSAGNGDAPGWDEIAEAAVRHDDEHVIKLVYTCRSEAAAWGDDLYRETAAHAVA